MVQWHAYLIRGPHLLRDEPQQHLANIPLPPLHPLHLLGSHTDRQCTHETNVSHERSPPAIAEGKTRVCGGDDHPQRMNHDRIGAQVWGRAEERVPLVGGFVRSGFEEQTSQRQGPISSLTFHQISHEWDCTYGKTKMSLTNGG